MYPWNLKKMPGTPATPAELKAKAEGSGGGAAAAEAVFEITDFTTASPWESFIADFERLIRDWGLGKGEDGAKPLTVNEQKDVELSIDGFDFRLTLFPGPTPTLSSRPDQQAGGAMSMEMMRRFKTGGLDATGIPSVMAELVSTTTDFCSGVHEVQLWYGVSAFILCSTVDGRYENKISEAQARLLTSALRTAVANTGCALPVFTQVAEARKKLFVGYGGERGMSTWFDTVVYPAAPEAYSHQAGLLDLFKSKVEPPTDSMRISITARFTYTSVNWFDEWLPSGELAARHLQARGRSDVYVDHPLTAMPCGLASDPINALSLSTIWPHFHEDAMLDTETYSELNPTDAPTWIVHCTCHDKLRGKLSGLLRTFTDLLGCDKSWEQLLGSSDAFEDDAQPNEPTARDVLNKNLGFGATSRSLVGKKIGGKLTSIERSIGNTVKRARDKVKSASTFSRKQDGLLPSEPDLDNMWRFMFKTINFRRRNPQGREASAAVVEGLPFRGCKSAPGKSLLGLFALYAALANLHNGGIVGIAVIWKELVVELRDCWTTLEVPGNVEYTDGPSMSNCLILQKIQMICTCIKRQKERDSLVKQSAAAVAEDDGDETSGVSDGDSSDCSEFQSADEEVSEAAPTVASTVPVPVPASVSAVLAESPRAIIAAVEQGVGIRKVSKTLRLLRSNVPLNIPITQEEAPMTEDVMEERQRQMTMMGTSKEAAQKRLEMQTLGLRSDMMAFKAANPGCMIDDFVRWHSPRDWIANAVGGEAVGLPVTMESPAEDTPNFGGCLSERMLSPENIWHKTWKDAQPRPVSKQRVLFDCAKEAEQALEYLECVEPKQVIWQMHAPLLEGAYTVLSEQVAMHSALDDPAGVMSMAMQKLRKLCSNFGNNFDTDCKRVECIIEQFLYIESLLAQMESLLNIIERINDELAACDQVTEVAQQQLAARLIDQQEHLILTKEERVIVAQMFQIDENALPGRKGDRSKRSASTEAFDEGIGDSIKTTREFLFRLVSARPSRTSRPAAHRMYCSLSEDSFRVSGATSTDELFQ